MALTSKSLGGLAALASIALCATTYFAVINPLNEQTAKGKQELSTVLDTTTFQQAKLAKIKNGAVDVEKATSEVTKFLTLAPNNLDIESMSRAISNSVEGGIKLQSFNFGSISAVTDNKPPTPSLTKQKAAGGSNSSTSSSGGSTDASGSAKDLFSQIPITITVSASSYEALAEYMDNLAAQPRLVNVQQFTSNGSNGGDAKSGGVTSTITALAYIYTGR